MVAIMKVRVSCEKIQKVTFVTSEHQTHRDLMITFEGHKSKHQGSQEHCESSDKEQMSHRM